MFTILFRIILQLNIDVNVTSSILLIYKKSLVI